MRRTVGTTTVALLVVLLMPFSAAAESGAGTDSEIKRGDCSGAATWKLRASPENGRIEVDAAVDSAGPGEEWKWRLLHNDSVTARNDATTKGPDGVFDIERTVVDLKGGDELKFVARNTESDERCSGTLIF